jgi:hypothetical protein
MSHDEKVELLGWIEDSTRRAANESLRRFRNQALIAFVVLLGGLAFAGKAWIGELQDGLRGSCDRVNVLRAQSNLSDSVSFNILSSSGIREKALAKSSPTKGERKTHNDSAEALFREADKLTVTVLTNCERAVDEADKYKTPVAGPIGEPRTGEFTEGVQHVLDDSIDYLRTHG